MDNEVLERMEILEERYAQVVAQNAQLHNKCESMQRTLEQIAARFTGGNQTTPPPTQGRSEETPASFSISEQPRRRVKPSPPSDFSGDRTKGRAFINSCDLYIRLASEQFSSEEDKINWAYSFMKSGRAALFVDRMMRFEARVGSPKFTEWAEFRKIFTAEFCLKNETQLALAKLETPAFYQGRRTVDEYVDEFRDLVDMAGYKEGLAIVIKFRRGLQRDIQDQIAQLPFGRPSDDDPEAWFQAALQSAANREANAAFHGVARITPTRAFTPTRPSTPLPAAPRQFSFTPTFTPPHPKNENGLVLTDTDAARKRVATPIICHRCGGPGHMAKDCPRRYDIRYLSLEEHEEWMQEQALQQDAEEARERAEEAEMLTATEEKDSAKTDFQRNRE
jgi:hypothetical protein